VVDWLAVPRTRAVFASRAFFVAAPTVWNSLPDNVVNSVTLATFKKRLKTYSFKASIEMFFPPNTSAFVIMTLYKFFSFIHYDS